MKAVVVYESYWGSTKEIAEAVAQGLGPDVRALNTDEATHDVVAGADLIVAGAPMHGFSLPREQGRQQLVEDRKAPRPADAAHPTLRTWIEGLPKGSGRCAGFDTRFKRSPGSAAKKARKELAKRGYTPLGEDGEFLITGTYGPLADGEIDRAREWGAALGRLCEDGAR